jgi:hypothetical protein
MSGRTGTVHGAAGSPRSAVPGERISRAGPASSANGAGGSGRRFRYPHQTELVL